MNFKSIPKFQSFLFISICMLGLALISCENASTEAPVTEAAPQEEVSSLEEDNKAVITKWIEARNTNDAEGALALWVDEWQERLTKGFNGTTEAFPDVNIGVDEMIAEGDKVVLRWTLTGTHQGNYQGIPATGKAIKWNGIDIYTLADGKIAGINRASDPNAIAKQLAAQE